LIGSLVILARDYFEKDFDKVTKEDLKDAVLKIDSRDDCSVWTKHGYKSILKKFYKWLVFGDDYKDKTEYPPIISWLRVNIKKKDQPRVQASDILTEKEIDELIEAAEHPRDKAFISMLYELGARIGEIGTLRIKDVSKDEHSFIIDLRGKTGYRPVRIVESDPLLTAWLNMHPLKDNPNAPLWILIGDRNKNKRMEYRAVRALVLRLAKKARLKKRVYPHLFRHSRVTHLLKNRQINESQAKVYFGWTPDSKMLSEYSHLTSQDVNDAMLEIHGIRMEEKPAREERVKQCPRCKAINRKNYSFCGVCGNILDPKTAMEFDRRRKGGDELLNAIAKNPRAKSRFAEAIAILQAIDKLRAIDSGDIE
jgi:integrase